MRYHLTPVRMAIIKIYKQQILDRVWRKGNPLTWLVVQPLWRTVWRLLKWWKICFYFIWKKLKKDEKYKKRWKIELLFDSTILVLGIYPEKTIIQRDTCTCVHCTTIYNSQNMEKPYVESPIQTRIWKQQVHQQRNG